MQKTAIASIFDSLPATGYIRQSQLIPDVVPFSSATLWRKVKAGEFPKPVKLSAQVTAWKVQHVREWLAAQESLGDAGAVQSNLRGKEGRKARAAALSA